MVHFFAIAVLAAFTIYWEKRQPLIWHYFLKPLTTIGIILLALNYGMPLDQLYSQLIVLGLLFSLAGDIFLMLPKDRFIPGLVSFLVAQILYAVAFIKFANDYSALLAFPLIIYGFWMFYILKPGLGKMVTPVLIYMLCILVMVWAALNMWWDSGQTIAGYAAFGAVLFVISDSLLAWNRFGHSRPYYRPLILSSYFAAQFLIASSVIQ
ncbi:MAG: lysoplasmalogenase [Candidatus Marinimicrobia bacterium]|nr:lysoplasmalogenase [Candidatus Neomarinimicrobiota bacterium]MCF7839716.1 lysoplasmalogenase [Candidatus Neomarinimicrobiota bacterium]MCF7903506.1 lysoplasmalogenase [Candidatus Neomarinimicrobiota bacterium]